MTRLTWHRVIGLSAAVLLTMAPLAFLMIQSSHDQYTPRDEANRLFALAREPKRFELVEGRDHRFDGDQKEFFDTLRNGLQWLAHAR